MNFVAQIVGAKRWLLLPPAATSALLPSRIPYEESSVYSSASVEDACGCASLGAMECVLEPGDVLYVPW